MPATESNRRIGSDCSRARPPTELRMYGWMLSAESHRRQTKNPGLEPGS